MTVRGFLTDRRGNYALMTALAMVPLMGGLAVAVDFGEMNRQKQRVANALDAAGIATDLLGRKVAGPAIGAAIRAARIRAIEAALAVAS